MGWLFYQLVIAPNGVRLLIQLKQLETQQQEKLDEITETVKELSHKKSSLQKDLVYLEFEARKDWAFVKPNEKRVSLTQYSESTEDR